MADLPTNYFDDILSESMNGKKKFRLAYRNGTTEEVTIEDISEYDQYGSKFGAGDINKTNQAVNEKFDAEDVVDPMLTTKEGFAADAYKTKLQFDEQNKKNNEYYNMLSEKILKLEEKVFGGITSDNGEIPYSNWYYEGTDYNIPVIFSDTFASVPKIRLSFNGQEPDTEITAKATDITTTGFNIKLSVSQDDKFSIYWTAAID